MEFESLEASRSKIKSSQQGELNRLKADFDRLVSELRQNHEREVAKLKQGQAAEIEKLQAEHQTAGQRIKSEIEKIRAQIESENQDQIAALKKRSEQQLNDVQERHAAKVSELNAANKRELEELRTAHRAKVDLMKTKHEENIREIQTRADQHLAAQRMKVQPQRVISPDLDVDRKRRKRRELADDLAKITARHEEIVADMKAELQQKLHRIQSDNARAIEVARNECQAEIRNYRDRVERQKKQMLSSVSEETRADTGHRVLVISRVFSLRPQRRVEKSPVKLCISRSQRLSIFDDEPFEGIMTRPATLFDSPATNVRRQSDGREFTLIEKKKKHLASIEALDVPDSESATLAIERVPDLGHHTIKKMKGGIDETSDQVLSGMNTAFDELGDQCREFKSFIQTEHRKLGRTVTEFRQRNLDANRAIHQSITEMQQAYHSALTSLTTTRRSSELPTQVMRPPSYHVAADSYAVPRGRSRSARRRADRG
jgi:hypothetical protein